ncbi:hypothetical protein CR155_02255 [Pollutimonas nitritireducens]|uniref:Uncharacterized protein n=1 Tax=Pollutimonas nitritireducens TaxID=2045209 RepID=A0A2N4ULJ5_9BURK|nr:hypothetical protein CR155_02255 [Pollutimonas nitritireducens]
MLAYRVLTLANLTIFFGPLSFIQNNPIFTIMSTCRWCKQGLCQFVITSLNFQLILMESVQQSRAATAQLQQHYV